MDISWIRSNNAYIYEYIAFLLLQDKSNKVILIELNPKSLQTFTKHREYIPPNSERNLNFGFR